MVTLRSQGPPALGDTPALLQHDRKAEKGTMATARDSDIRRFGYRRARSPGVGVLAALEGAVLIVCNLVATPFIGGRRLRWGTVGTEATDSLPGDELVPEPKWSYTLGMAVDASPEDVWPWIAQTRTGPRRFLHLSDASRTLPVAGSPTRRRSSPTTSIRRLAKTSHLHPTASKMRMRSWILQTPSSFSGPWPIWASRRAGECQPGSSPSTPAPMAAAGS